MQNHEKGSMMQGLDGLVKVGDVILHGSGGHQSSIEEVHRGQHGLFLIGTHVAGYLKGRYMRGYLVPEMPPPPMTVKPWKAFSSLTWGEIRGRRWALVSLSAYDGPHSLADYEEAWECSREMSEVGHE